MSLKAIKTGLEKLESEVAYYQSEYNFHPSTFTGENLQQAARKLFEFKRTCKSQLETIEKWPFLAK